MRKISIDELNEMVDSSYSLVTIISKRARQIIDGAKPLIETKTIKPVAVAIEEFYNKKFEVIYDYDKYLKEKEAKESETIEAEVTETPVMEEQSDNQSID
ncbi:MAG TPA: DNA-directed RNA polymerase subunit omega [Tissierellia bacterium]|jgi:DNA-directed RNA polymerase subunit omega|nr:DNA-directed RNA polymerase subunit omega [Tissierellia bacterium]